MTKKPEYEGKDLEDALQIAASEEGVPESELHYEIVEQGRRGVFGLGAKSVRIRIMPPLEEALPGAEPPPARNPQRPPQKSRRERPKAGRNPEGRGRPRRSRRRGPRRPRAAEGDAAPRAGLTGEPTAESEAVADTVRTMVQRMGFEIEVRSAGSEGRVAIDLQGPDRKLLTAKKGELLSAMQFLLNRMSRRSWPDAGRIDLGGREGGGRRRDDDLIELTREVAQQVSRTGKTKKLAPMNAYERRLVHLTVREFPGLSSSSDGDGSLKRVRISKVQNAI